MPSPTISRSKSAPDITSPYTDKSIRSTHSTGSPITVWPKKLNDLIATKTKGSSGGLTTEALQEFNSQETRNASSSPYYKGLTDFSLVINREKLSGSSPGRETTYVSYGSRTTSFVFRVHEWGSSCFSSKTHEEKISSSSISKNVVSGLAVTKIKKNELETERKRVTFPSKTREIISTEKPLRERDCESPAVHAAVPPPTIPTSEDLPLTPQTPLSIQDPAAGFLKGSRETNIAENERKYTWADKYRPFRLKDFLCNREKAMWLKTMVKNWDGKQNKCGHFIFEGNPGVGKRTMIWALLREACGENGVQANKVKKKFSLKGETVSSIEVDMMVSNHHIEVNLSEFKGYEKHVIVELIKENNANLPTETPHGMSECKAIVLYESERLSIDGLSYIKWMLEKFKGNSKIFFCCSDSSKLEVVKPLCKHIHLLEPSNTEILDVLAFVAEKEGIELPIKLGTEMAINAKNNLRQAIRSFEATWLFNGCRATLKEDQDIKTGWEDKIANIASNIIAEQSPRQLYVIRGELQNLIEHNVVPQFIFQTLKIELKKILSEQLKLQFDNLYDEYQKNHGIKYLANTHNQEELGKMQKDHKKNVQQFMRIEEFIARFMSWYKGRVTKNNDVEEMPQIDTT